MANPFLRRATEFIRDDSAFLEIVSPEPLTTFIANHPKRDALFDVPVRVIGSPGSGKTMMASLLEFRRVEAIIRDQGNENNRTLASTLSACGLVDGHRPLVAAVRVPLESTYRDFWELPYEPAVKTRLVLSLVQARAMLALIRNLTASGERALEGIKFVMKEDADASLDMIGGGVAVGVRERARRVERAVYSIVASLVPPALGALPDDALTPYQPFDVLREVEIDWDGEPIVLKPLAILDDVHALHPDQFESLFRSLARREIKIGRWMMMRMDALSPSAVFRSTDEEALPGLAADRDYIDIFMQSTSARGSERRQFRKIATDMADRYLRLVQPLRDRNLTSFSRLLSEQPPRLPAGKLEELRQSVVKEQRRLEVSDDRRAKIERLVQSHAKSAQSYDVGDDVQLGMQRILLNRYANRIANLTPALFVIDPEPKVPLKANAAVADGARAQLHLQYGRAFHYGIGDLCDASNENAELFLQLAGALVSRMETKAIRNQPPVLSPAEQQNELKTRSNEIIENWSFPYARKVRALVRLIADAATELSLTPNARVGSGANAYGVPEDEMAAVLQSHDELASVLKFAVAYGAIAAVRQYGQGSKYWCLLELSGPSCLANGLTLKRGGFVEGGTRALYDVIGQVD